MRLFGQVLPVATDHFGKRKAMNRFAMIRRTLRRGRSARAALVGTLVAAVACLASARTWHADPRGVGPLRIGMPLKQVNRIVGQSLAPPDPPEADPSNECWQAHLKSQPVDLMFLHGVLVRIDVNASGVSTDRGVEVGQPVEAIRAAYGPRIARRARGGLPDDSATWMMVSRDRGIRFEVVAGKVAAFYVGTAAAVGLSDGCA